MTTPPPREAVGPCRQRVSRAAGSFGKRRRHHAAMDTRWQPPLDHAPASIEPNAEARGLFAGGWIATRDECRVVNPADRSEQVVSPETWRALRELDAGVPVRLTPQEQALGA
jgi:hypothetical protein